ncbi:MAG: lipoprotein [Methanosaeta sp. NSP1]|nr:MAG: lipoprotein [Methanosaeta sp. NSP1]
MPEGKSIFYVYCIKHGLPARNPYGLEKISASFMISRNIICILFISLVLASSIGCLARDSAGTPEANSAIPRENLPQGFKLLAVLPEMDSSVNMTDYIEDFYGDLDIGPANVSVGIYQWGELGDSYDAKVTLIQLADEEAANNAVSNFKSQYDDMVARGLPIFSNATINGHESLQIKDLRGDNSIRYLFLWNTNSQVTLVEGNDNRNQSLELAEATGL